MRLQQETLGRHVQFCSSDCFWVHIKCFVRRHVPVSHIPPSLQYQYFEISLKSVWGSCFIWQSSLPVPRSSLHGTESLSPPHAPHFSWSPSLLRQRWCKKCPPRFPLSQCTGLKRRSPGQILLRSYSLGLSKNCPSYGGCFVDWDVHWQ